jgi:hypothetical protein
LDKKLLPLFAYMDKHNVALMQGLGDTVEFKERVIDNIVYGFIAIAIYDEYSKKTHSDCNGGDETCKWCIDYKSS